jgi:hypothetical protein
MPKTTMRPLADTMLIAFMSPAERTGHQAAHHQINLAESNYRAGRPSTRLNLERHRIVSCASFEGALSFTLFAATAVTT